MVDYNYSTAITTDAWFFTNSNGTAATTDTAWTQWTTGTVSFKDCYVMQTWATWQDANSVRVTLPVYQMPPAREVTPEEVAAIEARQHELDERRRVQIQALEAARELLLECLSDEQRKDYEEHMKFTVHGSKGGVYSIGCGSGTAGNVRSLDKHRRYCIHHTQNDIPAPDTFLAQKLLLEHDEDEFLAVANAS